MDKCEYYKVKEFKKLICMNHKYYLECNCDGDRKKCDYFLAIREEAREQDRENIYMNTVEMWAQAQENGKAYQLMNEKVKIYYRKDRGIFDSEGYHVSISRLGEIDTFMNRHWQEATPVLTKSEAEAKFGIKIVGN